MKFSSNSRRALLVSASFPLSALLGVSAAQAETPVTVATATTTPVVNAQIATAEATPDPDIKITVTSDGTVTGGGNITLSKLAAGQGDGKITFTNAGLIGAVDKAGAVTDAVGVRLNGAGAGVTGNILTGGNSNLITNGFNGTQFGGTVDFTNTGTIFGGVVLSGFGNTTFTQAATGAVRSGNVDVRSLQNTTSKTDPATSTTTTTSGSGNTKIDVQGGVVSADGKTFGTVVADSYGNTDATINATTGAVTVTSGGAFVQVAKTGTAAAGKTVVTSETVTTGAPSTDTVKVGAAGNINGNLSATAFSQNNTLNRTTITQDAGGNTTAQLIEAASTTVGGTTAIAIDAGGKVTGNVNAGTTSADATVSSAGTIGGSLTAGSAGTSTTSSNLNTFDAKGAFLGNTSSNTSKSSGGKATVLVDTAGTVGTTVAVSGNAGATLTVAGAVTNGATVTSTGTDGANGNSSVVAAGITTSNGSTASSKNIGGTAALTVATGGSIGGTATLNGGGGATASVAGTIKGDLNTTSIASNTTNASANTFDPTTGALTKGTTANTAAASGGAATIDIAKGGTIGGTLNANADSGVTVTNAGTITNALNATSARFLSTSSSTSTQPTTTVTAADKSSATTTTITSSKSAGQTVGGAVSITNGATGLVGSPTGSIFVSAVGDVTNANAGTVRGQTNLNSAGVNNTASNDQSTIAVTVFGVAPALDVTTTTTTTASTNANGRSGGSVSGTYTGANGTLNFVPAADGSIFQTADKNSTVAISGSVFGNVGSTAGQTNSSASNGTTSVSVLDSAGTGTIKSSTAANTTITPYSGGGTSTVTVTGTVAPGNTGSAASVSSNGTAASVVTLNGGKVSGSVNSTGSGLVSNVTDSAQSYDQTSTKAVLATNNILKTNANKQSLTGGAASADVLGASTVGGSVNVNGIAGATSTVASGAKITGGLSVTAGGSDTTSATTSKYARDAKAGTIAASQLTVTTSAPSAASGNAGATVGGTVSGSTSVTTSRGDATATITGVSTGGVFANASGTASSNSTLNTYAGKAGATTAVDADVAIAGLPATALTSTVFDNSSTATGGKASIVIDTAQALKDSGTLATGAGSSVSANGLGGGAVSVKAGSIVGGSASASSAYLNTTFKQTTTYGASQDLTSLSTSTVVGGTASVDNAGTINGSASTSGLTSTLSNTGKIVGSASSNALFSLATSTAVTDTNQLVPALETKTTVTTYSVAGGDAKVTNAAGALVGGNVSVSGKTGSVTNSGIIAGTTTLGASVQDFTTTDVRTGSTTTQSFVQPATLNTQTYTLDQNGLSRGITVQGANGTVPLDTPRTVKTSNITATINLNTGSATLGNIGAQTDATGARLTNTTVNLNGSGFLGADVVFGPTAIVPVSTRTPYLTLTQAQLDAGFGGTSAVTVRGVAALNKTGTGTFVINGANYVAPLTPAGLPGYTLDVGAFNVNGGEVQLTTPAAPVGSATVAEFGIRGDINNSASLVIGRRLPASIQLLGNSLVGSAETIQGITVRQVGNYTQTATGTTVVGVTPSLARFYNTTVNTGSTVSEPLAPLTSGVSVAYFTVPGNAGVVASTPSRVNITGNLNLAGTVAVDVTRDGLYLNGDGYTLFTYTGTGTVTANVASSISSPFVKFSLVNDAAAKTVRISAARTSYATAATDANAAAAAVALDSALPVIAAKIKADASGGAVFTSVSDIGYAQDLANISSALDFRLTAAQAAEVFTELSSAEFYGSMSSVNQNVVFGDTVNQLTNRRAYGAPLTTQLWINPVASFARYGGGDAGATPIKVTSYGAAAGLDLAYSPTGVFGFGGAYGEHDVAARGTPESGRVRTWTAGAYVSQGFGPIYVNGSLAYGFSRFTAQRNLPLLARTIGGTFRGHQFDAALEAGYDFKLQAVTVTPFAKVAIRDLSFNGFNETGGGGAGLIVQSRSQSQVSPVVGVKIGGSFGDADRAAFRPYAKGFYTFQGNVANDRSVQYIGGGDSFVLRGVRPQDYGTVEAGVESTVSGRLNLYLAGGYSFGGNNSVGSIRGGLAFRF